MVDLPLSISGVPRRERDTRAAELFETLGVEHVAHLMPHQMSGGEQQRVAICVALANRPAVLLTDEPTGELDSVTAHEVFDALRTANREWGTTVVVVTHDVAVSGHVARTVAIRDGRTAARYSAAAISEALRVSQRSSPSWIAPDASRCRASSARPSRSRTGSVSH